MDRRHTVKKRGLKGATKKVTKMVEKTFERNARRQKEILAGKRKPQIKPPKTRDREMVNTGDSVVSGKDMKTGAKGMAPAGAALGGGLALSALLGPSIKANIAKSQPPNQTAKSTRGSNLFSRLNGIASMTGTASRMHEYMKAHPSTKLAEHQGVDYLQAPLRFGTASHGHAPKMWAKARQGDVEVVIKHTEYVNDLVSLGSANWPNINGALQQLAINPGQSTVFPWLATLARNFDEYKFDSLKFVFQPMLGTGTNGKLVATFDPDVLDEFPDTKQDALEARVQLDSSVWMPGTLTIPKDLLSDFLYVRPGALPAGADQHVYDVGALNLGLPGVPAGSVAEMFVEYTVRLKTPNGGQRYMAGAVYSVNASAGSPLGTAILVNGNIPVVRNSATSFTITAPGTYWLFMASTGTGITSSGVLLPTGTNLVDYQGNFATYSTGGTSTCYTASLTVVDNTAPFTITSPVSTTLTATRLTLAQWDPDLHA